MSKKQKQLLLAIVLAIVVALAHHFYLDSQISQYRDVPSIKVLRASRPLAAGTIVSNEMLDEVRVPEQFAPKDRFLASQKDQIIGQKLAADVPKGNYLVAGYFSAILPVGRTLADQLSGQDFRAISIPVDETNSLAQSLHAGDKIDILYTFNLPPLRQSVSTVLLQNVPIISTGLYSASEQERAGEGIRGRAFSTITLRLPLRDAVRLNYARNEGKISVMLRASSDNGAPSIAPVSSISDILAPADKEALQQTMQEYAKTARADEDRYREQVKMLLEQQRQQRLPSAQRQE